MHLPLYIVGGHVLFMSTQTINWKFILRKLKVKLLKIGIMLVGCFNYGCIEFSLLMIIYEMLRISEKMNLSTSEIII